MKSITIASIVLAAAACGGSKSSPPAGPKVGDAVPAGHYGCRIVQGGWAYDYYACDVRADGGGLAIEKIEGQMRFKGTLTPAADGSLAFAGEVWCTWDDNCKGSTTGTLAVVEGGWEGALAPYPMQSGDEMPTMTISLLREATLEGAGGARYGGYGEGGWKGGGYTGAVTGE